MARVARLPSLAIAAALGLAVGSARSGPEGPNAGKQADSALEEARLLVEEWAGAGYARREEITRELVAMDDRAVAALVVARRRQSASTREWAADMLESMGRERADEQIRTRSDATLVAIFRAYGEARDPDALGVLSSFIGSDRAEPREAARAALARYGRNAISTLRRDYTELTGKLPPGTWSAEETARELFAASDRIRLRDVDSLLDGGLARAESGDLSGRRAEIARIYAAYGMEIEDRDPVSARAYLERAARLDPDGQAAQIAAELAVLEGRELEGRGLVDEAPYRRALSLDPANAHARAAVDRLGARDDSRRAMAERWTLGLAVALASLLACILFVGRRAAHPRDKTKAGARE